MEQQSGDYQDPEKFKLAITRAVKRQKKQEKIRQRQIYNTIIPQYQPTTTQHNVLQTSSKYKQQIQPKQKGDSKEVSEESSESEEDDSPDQIQSPNDVFMLKVHQEEDLDDVVTNLIDELKEQADNQANSAYWGSIRFKIADGFFRVLIVLMGIVIGILGQNGISSDNVETISLVVAIMGFAVSGLSEIRDQFEFKDRSGVMRRCYQDFKKISNDLRLLRVSGKDPIDIIVHISDIEFRLNNIDLEAFGSQIVKTGEPHEFKTRCHSQCKNTNTEREQYFTNSPNSHPKLKKTTPKGTTLEDSSSNSEVSVNMDN
jgi:hypothetical protein